MSETGAGAAPAGPKKSSPNRSLQFLLGFLLLGLISLRLIYQPVVVSQHSMEPTLQAGDRLLVHRHARRSNVPLREDIVVFREPGSDSLAVKRVVGLPGEEVFVSPRGVSIDGKPIHEPYLTRAGGYYAYDQRWLVGRVPEGSVFVLGDNRPASRDSRDYGAVPIKDLLGVAVVRFWPWERRGLLP